MTRDKLELVLNAAKIVRTQLCYKYGANNLDGTCKLAAELLIERLKSLGITASQHYGWCLYDDCANSTDEPCAPHSYVLVHDGTNRHYLDITATQFQFALEDEIPEIIFLASGKRPYWFRSKKPSAKEMEEACGW